jgi:hypothetical protein
LLLKLLEMLGHAKATMPSRQADLDQKSVCRKNQSKRPFPDHSADRVIWATKTGTTSTAPPRPVNFAPTPTWGEGSGVKVIYGVVAPAQPPRMDWCASNGHIVAAVHESDHGTFRTSRDVLRYAHQSRRRSTTYRGGPCPHWIKVKNADAPAMHRAENWVQSKRKSAR